nr:hypothetical protein GCM10020185_45970 [Pseudomonas brassicacearum subsp. brassicacearum]
MLRALWEISAPVVASTTNAFNDLGYAYARPEVARLADGRWAAFISNGYGSNSGVAALYVVDIRDGSLIRKIVINSSETGNGLSSVKLRVNSQNVVQAAYGGDLKGRMWKFDLSGTSPTAWGVAFAGQPLFTTSGGATQPITVQPLLADNPQGGTQVFFSAPASSTKPRINSTRTCKGSTRYGTPPAVPGKSPCRACRPSRSRECSQAARGSS